MITWIADRFCVTIGSLTVEEGEAEESVSVMSTRETQPAPKALKTEGVMSQGVWVPLEVGKARKQIPPKASKEVKPLPTPGF